MTRMEKIRLIREKEIDKIKLKVTIKPGVLSFPEDKTTPDVCGDQPERFITDVPVDQAEQHGSTSTSHTQNIRQSHTTPWAVARYVSIPLITNLVPILTNKTPGTPPIQCQAEELSSEDSQAEHRQCLPETDSREGQAEQNCIADSQAEHCTDETKSHLITDRAEPCPTRR